MVGHFDMAQALPEIPVSEIEPLILRIEYSTEHNELQNTFSSLAAPALSF